MAVVLFRGAAATCTCCLCLLLLLVLPCAVVSFAFAPSPLTYSRFQGTPLAVVSKLPSSAAGRRRSSSWSRSSTTTSLRMFLGNDGGILGVGAPEVFTILLVGYFVLGPSDLYKVVKEVGKGIQNLRTLSSDVTKTFENNMESQLQLEDLRKAQRELNDAFSFRRSINVDVDAEFNTVVSSSSTTNATATATTSAEATSTPETTDNTASPQTRKKRKRVKKKMAVEEKMNVPDYLEMPPLDDTLIREEQDERERLRRERLERLELGTQQQQQQPWSREEPQSSSSSSSWSLSSSLEEKERFAQQLSGNWNDYILQNEDKSSPLSKVMERLAILEEEKQAAEARLEEEFRLRAGLEERYYQEKRAILEEVAMELQTTEASYVSIGTTEEEEEEKKKSSNKSQPRTIP